MKKKKRERERLKKLLKNGVLFGEQIFKIKIKNYLNARARSLFVL